MIPIPVLAARDVPWVTVAQMREVDRAMVEYVGIDLVRMMENAGRAVAVIARVMLDGDVLGRRVVVLGGPGGNGGGGLVAARHLVSAGADVQVLLAFGDDGPGAVTSAQLEIARRVGIPVTDSESVEGPSHADLVIDALLGYGQIGPPRGRFADLIRGTARQRVLAVDVPSGVELETGLVHMPAVTAEATVTVALPKAGLATGDARTRAGRLFVADISVPPIVLAAAGIAAGAVFARGPIIEVARDAASGGRDRQDGTV